VVVASWCGCGPAIADDAAKVGAVLAVRGAVFTDSAGSMRPLAVQAPVRERDAIVATDGKAKIALDDGTIISVAEHTRVHISQFRKAAQATRTKLELVSGALRVFVAKVAPNGHFEIETETAIAVVRGTDWLVEALPDRTSVALLRGDVAVTGRDPRAAGSVVLQQAGQGTDVRRGAAPTAPIPWGAGRLADLLARATFN
jgi:hypothetical protein